MLLIVFLTSYMYNIYWGLVLRSNNILLYNALLLDWNNAMFNQYKSTTVITKIHTKYKSCTYLQRYLNSYGQMLLLFTSTFVLLFNL